MNWDNSGSLFALGLRMTLLDSTGAPLIGTRTCYVTEALMTLGIGLSYEDGQQITQRNGAGNLCLSYKAPDTLTNGVVDGMQVCTPDPNILKFAIGGDTIERAAVSEVQTVTITGTPTGGTFTLTYNGQTTAPIAYNAVASAVQSALEALSNVAPGDVTVGGGPGPGTPYTVTFDADLGNVVQMSASGAALTGGSSPAAGVATTTPGLSALAIGYKAPQVGVTSNPYGIGLEFWTHNIVDGAANADLPYMHWTLPRTTLRLNENMNAGPEAALTPNFAGTSAQNPNWGAGPEGDWPLSAAGAADRVWQFVRVATIPDLTRGYVEIAA
jgi:hypothetical protein